VLFYQAPSGFMESAFVIQQINNIIQQKKLQYKDIAILYRAKYQSRDVEQQLIKNNIPFYVHGDAQFYQRKEIRDIIAYLRLLVDENNELALKRIINVPSRMIGQTTTDNITKQASTNNQMFVQELKSSTNKNIVAFLEMMEQLRIKAQGLSIVEKTKLIIKEINYYQYLQTLDVESNDRKENINEVVYLFNN
jgi:DNA helicase-2/ATP-dependent DNA helicase PcrA